MAELMKNRMVEFISHYVEALEKSFDDGSDYIRDKMNLLLQKFELTTQLEYPASVAIRHELKVPLREKLIVPVDAKVKINTIVHSTVNIPLELTLSEKDLGIDTLSIEVDQQMMIEDELELDVKDLLDSMVDLDKSWVDRLRNSLPLKKKAKLKINQPLRIKGRLTPHVRGVNIKLKKDISVTLDVPINQEVQAKGEATVTLIKEVSAPINASVPVILDQPIKIKILGLKLNDKHHSETLDHSDSSLDVKHREPSQ